MARTPVVALPVSQPAVSAAAMGLRVHSGWAAVVALGGTRAAPGVLYRGRLELLDGTIHGAEQPYHAAAEMSLPEAQRFLARCEQRAQRAASDALASLLANLRRDGHAVARAALLLSSGRSLPGLAQTLAAHPLIHAAEGQHFRTALREAGTHLGLTVRGIVARDLPATVQELGETPARLERMIGQLGRGIGVPWGKDQKLAAFAAWVVLEDSAE